MYNFLHYFHALPKRKKVIFATAVLFLFVILLTFITGENRDKVFLNPKPTNIPITPLFPGQKASSQVSPLQKGVIGEKIVESNITSRPDFFQKSSLGNNTISYAFRSEIKSRPSEVITQNDTAIYERIMIPSRKSMEGYVTISEFVAAYGEPEKKVKGSFLYDWVGTHYIYAEKGFAFVANEYTGEIFEVYTFTPMSVEEYIKKYGDDISEKAEHIQE